MTLHILSDARASNQQGGKDKQMKNIEAETTSDDRVSALRSALRSAPRKKAARSRSPLKAAVAQLLPDLLAFRAKGYNSAELAQIMRDNGFNIAAATLNKYINEARGGSTKKPKKKAVIKRSRAIPAPRSSASAAKPSSGAIEPAETITIPPSLLATKPLAQKKRAAREVLGHRFDDDL